MRRIERVIIISSIAISVLYIVICMYEIVNVRWVFETYSRVYGLNDNADHWQFKSILNYQIWQGINILVAAFIAVIGFKILRGINLRIAYYTALVICLIWFLRYYILWYKSGFDHYPGFDPYIF